MKKNILEFMRRGCCASGFGPLVLLVVYWILYKQGIVETVSVPEVCLGTFSLTLLAFIAGGLNFLYQIEKLPLAMAILIHGGVLYVCYLATYLVNGWLGMGLTPVLVFSGIFVVGYLGIWAVIYFINRRNTARVNAMLKQKQLTDDGSFL